MINVRQSDLPTVLRQRFVSLFMDSDTTPTRFMLASAATFWAVALWLPGNTLTRPVYRYMALLGSEAMWAALWTVAAALMWWRVFDAVTRPKWALGTNALMLALFSSTTVAIYASATFPIPAAAATDAVFTLAAFWVLIRTSVNSRQPGWRNE